MANPANFPNRPFRLEAAAWVLSQSVAGNSSRVRTQLWIKKNSYSPSNSPSGSSFTFFVNGNQVAGNAFGFDFRNSDTLLLAEIDVDVPHNSDGTKTIGIQGYCGADILGYTEIATDMGLPSIPRASNASFAGGETFEAGSPVTINTNRKVGSYTHTLLWSFGTLAGQQIASGVGASTTWTPPLSMLEQIPNAIAGQGTLTTRTYSGGTLVGTTTTTFVLRAPATVVPQVTSIAVADQNPDVVSVVGAFVQGLSRARITVAGTGAYGSTITAAQASLLGSTVASGGEIAVTAAGALDVAAQVTDTRGRIATSNGTLPVLPYAPPAATSYQARRCTSVGTPADDGTYLRVDLAASIASLVNGTQRNQLTIRAFTRPSGTVPWTARNVITPGGLSYATWFLISGGGVFATTSSYDVRVQVHDRFGTFIADATVSTIGVTLDLYGANVGIGKIWEQGVLDVGGQIFQGGMPVIDAGDTATTSVAGVVELATSAEAVAGVDTVRAVTPSALKAALEAGDTGWIVLPLQPGWGPYATEVAYYRIRDGWCSFMGRISGGTTAGTTIAILPAAARHTGPLAGYWNTHSDNGSTIIGVEPTGTIVIASRQGQTRTGVSLAGIAYPVG